MAGKKAAGDKSSKRKEAQLSRELHALQAESTNEDIIQLLKANPQHALAVLRYLKGLAEGGGDEAVQPIDKDRFPACYNKMQQLPKSYVCEALQHMSGKLDLALINQMAPLDKDVVFKLFFFGVGMERDAKLISKSKAECLEKCMSRHLALRSPLDRMLFQEVKATKTHLQPDWMQSGVFTLLPTLAESDDKTKHKFTEILDSYTNKQAKLPEHTSFDGTWYLQGNWSRAQAVLVNPDSVTEVKVHSLFPALPAGDVLANMANTPPKGGGLGAVGDGQTGPKRTAPTAEEAIDGAGGQEGNLKKHKGPSSAPAIPASLGGTGALIV